MKHFKKGLLAAAALLVLSAVTASAAAAPYASSSTAAHIKHPADANAQLKIIAEAEPLWKDEFVARWDAGQTPQPHLMRFNRRLTHIAVTDLDANGRLELLVRHAMTLMDISGPHAAGVVDIPIDISLSAYEISADGRLERLHAENGYDWPDLMNLQPLSEIDEHGTRWHHVRTVTVSRGSCFTDNDPSYTYTASYQRVALDHGTLRCQLLAVEKGSYRDVDSPSTCRKINVSASVFDGDPAHTNMSGRQFQQTYLYQTFDEALLPPSSIRWVSGDELNRDPHEALAASWAGFVYGVIDGKG